MHYSVRESRVEAAENKTDLRSREWAGNLSALAQGPWCFSCPRYRPESTGWAVTGTWSRRRCGWWTWQRACGWSGPRGSAAPEGSRQREAAKAWPRSAPWLSSDRCVCGGSWLSLQTRRCWGTADSWTEPQTGKKQGKQLRKQMW